MHPLLQENRPFLQRNLPEQQDAIYSKIAVMENGQVRFSAQFALATMTVAIVLTGAHSAAGTPHGLQSQVKPSARFEEPVDINTATLEQLMKIPGLTRTWAARIIRFRPYRQKNELLDNGIVSSEVYSRIKDHIIAHRQAR